MHVVLETLGYRPNSIENIDDVSENESTVIHSRSKAIFVSFSNA